MPMTAREARVAGGLVGDLRNRSTGIGAVGKASAALIDDHKAGPDESSGDKCDRSKNHVDDDDDDDNSDIVNGDSGCAYDYAD